MTALAPLALALAPALGGGSDFQEEPFLVPAAAATGQGFGWDVVLSGDELYVGAPNDLGKSPLQGAVHRFRLDPGGWTEVETIQPSGAYLGDRFGVAVDVDASTLAVLVWSIPTGTDLWVFERSGSAWVESGVIALPSLPQQVDNPNVTHRPQVAVDGARIAVGIPMYGPVWYDGRVVVVERTGPDWSQTTQQVLNHPFTPQNDELGYGLDLDGSWLAVGVPSDEPPGLQSSTDWGSVYLYERGPTQWDFVERVDNSAPFGRERFGSDVLMEDGWLFIASTPTSTVAEVSVYRQVGGAWTLLQSFQQAPPNQPGGWDRYRASLSWDQGRLVVGAPLDAATGAVWVYTLEAGQFVFRERLVATGAAPMQFAGKAVAAGLDRVLFGAPGTDAAGPSSGVVHSFRFDNPLPTAYCTGKVTADGCTPAIASTGVPSLTGDDDFVVTCTDTAPLKTGLFFYGTNGPAALPFLGGTLCVQPSLTRTLPQAAAGSGTCGGSYSFPFTQARMDADGLVAGGAVHGQWWLRDPQNPDGTGVALSDGLAITIGL